MWVYWAILAFDNVDNSTDEWFILSLVLGERGLVSLEVRVYADRSQVKGVLTLSIPEIGVFARYRLSKHGFFGKMMRASKHALVVIPEFRAKVPPGMGSHLVLASKTSRCIS